MINIITRRHTFVDYKKKAIGIEMGIIVKIQLWIMDIQLLMNFSVKTSLFIQNTFHSIH